MVVNRLEKELHSIISNGLRRDVYHRPEAGVESPTTTGYLVDREVSVGSSFVATMAGITEVNPLPPHYYCPLLPLQ